MPKPLFRRARRRGRRIVRLGWSGHETRGAMAGVTFDGVSKVYPDGTRAVDRMSLDIKDGEFMVLVGPSGCGKTTALRMLAGLEDISEGRVVIGERVVNHVPSRDRDIAMVFQSYALYPHLSVYENIAFGLRVKKVPKAEIDKRVKDAARILDLDQLLDRKPRALSGGQRQRVAMGRAIVRHPQAFLMDEPLSNLDAKLRVQTRAEIAQPAARPRRHDDLRHARPGRGAHHGRPRRGHAQGPVAAGRQPAGALRQAAQPVRRRLHRKPGDEHARGQARAERQRLRRAGRAPSRSRSTTRRSPRIRRSRTTSGARSSSASVPRTSRTRRSRRTRRPTAGSRARWSSRRRSAPR